MVFYPYGVQYHRAPTPLCGEWADDLREISQVGYTHVQFRPQWRWHERVRGHFAWDDLDRLFELAHTNRLRVVLKPMLETAPDWVFGDLGGTRVGFHDVPLSPIATGSFYVGGWLPCFDNLEVASAAQSFVRELALRYHEHPALWIYNAWNEPRSRPLGQCQCKHSVDSYRTWLRDRFGGIDNLNRDYGKAWSSFDTVCPPQSGWDYAEMFLWRQWAAWAVASHVRLVSEAIRDADPDAFVMAHVGYCSVTQDAVCDASDDLSNAAVVDRYGTSFPVSLCPTNAIEWSGPDLISDWLRRVDTDYWCHEFYPNHGDWCKPTEPDKLRQLIWMAVSGGATGFTFWQYRSERLGNETNGYGLREIDGSPTARSRVADGIAGILRLHGSKLAGAPHAASRVALVYSRENDLLSRIIAMKDIFAANEEPNVDYPYKRAIRAAHALYMQVGETVDFVVPGDDLSQYKLLHVTAMEIVDPVTADWLRTYVHGGGILVIEYPFACRDRKTWVSPQRPNCGLQDIVGCRESSRLVSSPDDKALFTCGLAVAAGDWRIDIEPLDSEVIAEWPDGGTAAVRKSCGAGRTYTLGPSLSLGFADNPGDRLFEVLEWLFDDAGLERGTPTTCGVRVRRRTGTDSDVWFVFNVSDETQVVELPAHPTELWQSAGCRQTGLSLELSPGATWVAELPS